MDIAFSLPVGLSTTKQCWAHLSWQFLCLFSDPSACRSINIYFLPFLTNQRIMEYFRLWRLLEIIFPFTQRRVKLSYSRPCLHKLWMPWKKREPPRPLQTLSSVNHHSSMRAAWTAKMKGRKAFSISGSDSKVPTPLSSSPTFCPRIPVVIDVFGKEKLISHFPRYSQERMGHFQGIIHAGSIKLMTNPGSVLFFKYPFYLSYQLNFLSWKL